MAFHPDRITWISGDFKKRKKRYKSTEPYLCKTCDRVWQSTVNCIYVEYVFDFPKYGCSIRECKSCKKGIKSGKTKRNK